MKKFLVADLLCGAGGSSTGAMRAIRKMGYEMELVCLNHWQTAINTHQKNHPEARHYVQDIATINPYIAVPEGYLDLLMASPSCVHHSNARGGKPTSDQQRSDPWHIITWLTQLRVKRMIIENVWEFCLEEETTILTKRGLIPIREILVGDEVWTHKNRWRPVTNVIQRAKPVYRVNGHEHSITEATENHRFYTTGKARRIIPDPRKTLENHSGQQTTMPDLHKNKEKAWTKAEDLDFTYWASPNIMPFEQAPLPESLVEYSDNPEIYNENVQRFFFTVGRFLATGGVDKKDDNIIAYLHDYRGDEADLNEVGSLLAGSWERKAETPFYNVFKLEGNQGADLVSWTLEFFSTPDLKRVFPNFMYSIPASCKTAFWNGYIRHADLDTLPNEYVQDNYSREFAVGVKLMLQSIGHTCELHLRDKPSNNTVTDKMIAGMVAPPTSTDLQPNSTEKTYVLQRCNEIYDNFYDEDHRWSVVYNIYEDGEIKNVVDITVEEDHSFVADGQVTHNCNWGPVDEKTGKPIKERKGEYFQAWINVIRSLGFEPKWHKLNAADYGDATTRERFILMARSDGRRLIWPAKTHVSLKDAHLPENKGKKIWRAADDIIDWNRKGRSIFNRPKPLAENTIKRIYKGAQRENWPEPYLVVLRNHMHARGIELPIPTVSAGGTHIGIAQPIVVNMKGQSDGHSTKKPLPTQTSHAAHLYKADPVILSVHNTGTPRSTKQPLPTISTGGASNDKRPGCARPMLVEAIEQPFVLSQASGGQSRPTYAPCPTSTGGGNGATHALIVPLTHTKSDISPKNAKVPLPTITTAKGGEQALVEPAHRFIDKDGIEYDILFRMLEDYELAAAMGFDTEEEKYEFTGTKTQRIKQIGNAVSVRKMRACVEAILFDEVETDQKNVA